MWLAVLGIPLGIIVAVLALPPKSGEFLSFFMMLAAVTAIAGGLFLRRGGGYLPAVLGLVAMTLLGVVLGTQVNQRFSPWTLDQDTSYFLTGVVSDVPKVSRFSRRYRVRAACLGHSATDCSEFNNRIPVLWPVLVEVTVYDSGLELKPGQQIRMQVQTKSSRRQSGPAAFDLDRWLRANHIVARVKLKRDSEVTRLGESWFTLDRLRTRLNRYLAQREEQPGLAGISSLPLVLALVSGDRSLMQDQHWDVFNRTGTTHLVAISGLHVGLVATLVTFVSLPLFRRWRFFTDRYPASHGALVTAWVAGLFYTALAGFAIPTQRALIMLSVFVILKLLGRAQHLWFGLASALCLVLLWDPVACLSMGFWLSFLAVYLILWLIGGGVGERSRLSQWSAVQLGLFVGLAPVLLWSVHSVSLVSALTNAVAIPLIGLVVVPLSLAWTSLWAVLGDQAEWLLQLVTWIMDGLLWLLSQVASWRYSVWTVGERSLTSLILAMIGVMWLVSAGLPGRGWGVALMLPLLLPQTQGTGLYVMGTGSGRILWQAEDRVWSVSRSHWPQPVARWQEDLMAHWGIAIPVDQVPLHQTRDLWLARDGVFSEFELHQDRLGARTLQSGRYSALCDRDRWRSGGVQFRLYRSTKKPSRCAVAMQWGDVRWLYWPLETLRDQRSVLEVIGPERFDVVLVDVGKSTSLETAVLSLLSHRGRVVSIKPLPKNVAELAADRAIPVHVVQTDGYYYQPLAHGGERAEIE